VIRVVTARQPDAHVAFAFEPVGPNGTENFHVAIRRCAGWNA
jgi:hypothetical protein